jgi:hypothetical protein
MARGVPMPLGLGAPLFEVAGCDFMFLRRRRKPGFLDNPLPTNGFYSRSSFSLCPCSSGFQNRVAAMLHGSGAHKLKNKPNGC